jgi:hypothetical protein
MPPETSPLSLAPLLARFATESALIRRLALSDETFRGIAEDFLLAHHTLSALKRQPVAQHARIKEYADLVAQLEQDLRKHLARLNPEAS